MAIGLIMQAAGMAATMASSMVDDKEFVEKTSTDTPVLSSFQNAGLYNNAIGDVGRVDTYENTTEQTGLKKGLAGLGSALSIGSQFVGAMPERTDTEKLAAKDNRIANRTDRRINRSNQRSLNEIGNYNNDFNIT